MNYLDPLRTASGSPSSSSDDFWPEVDDALELVGTKPAGNGSKPEDRDPAEPAAGRMFVDWPAFWAEEHDEAEWLYPDVLARGRGHALYAAGGTGKSLFLLYIAAKLATGPEPVVVQYLDYEMTEADVRERLEDMGYGPGSDLSRLLYAFLPDVPALDTAEGGKALTELVDRAQKRWPDHQHVVLIDTFGRAVEGLQNDDSTVIAFDHYTGMELKRHHVTWARNDHAGKDVEKGQRGSSAKNDDVDVVWNLKQTNSGISLTCKKKRMPWVPDKVTLGLFEDPLRYTRLAGDWPEGTGEVANILDRLDLPINATVKAAKAALQAIDEGRRTDLVMAAVRFRKHKAEGRP